VLLPAAGGQRVSSLVVLVCSGLVVGALATAVLARSVAFPLREMRGVLGKVAQGDTGVGMRVDDSSEIGMLQAAVNDMVSGLREQDRLRDLFGRHVGADVARQALEYGVSLTGEVREVTALFVDVVDSTVLAHQMPPQELVGKLNKLFSAVVDAVSANHGLVNKFQGDAVLCVFGAPTPLPDAATSALRTARRIRDEVCEAGELDLGIGLACGPVFAGHLGADMRLEYTVIGDAVNEAARLTESAKHVPGRILASDAVLHACRTPACDGECERWRRHGSLQLRGRDEPTEVWVDHSTAPCVPETR
jgi:adenylate cyclase